MTLVVLRKDVSVSEVIGKGKLPHILAERIISNRVLDQKTKDQITQLSNAIWSSLGRTPLKWHMKPEQIAEYKRLNVVYLDQIEGIIRKVAIENPDASFLVQRHEKGIIVLSAGFDMRLWLVIEDFSFGSRQYFSNGASISRDKTEILSVAEDVLKFQPPKN